MVFVFNGLQVFGDSGLQGLCGLANVLFAAFFALNHVYYSWCVTSGLAVCVECPSGNIASHLS